MHANNSKKGSIKFVLYFIIGTALLAVAGYFIGINEQASLFKSISDKKISQDNATLNGLIADQGTDAFNLQKNQGGPTKSLIDSPALLLKNISSGNNVIVGQGNMMNGVGNQDGTGGAGSAGAASNSDPLLAFAANSLYFIKSTENKSGVNVKLVNGQAKGDTCYNTQTARVCFPVYKLDNVWVTGDLNGDKINDAIISVSVTESTAPDAVKNNSFFAVISNPPPSPAITAKLKASSSAYSIVPFNYGLTAPIISTVEINDGVVSMIGGFYATGDVWGKPSVNKVAKYIFVANNTISNTTLDTTLSAASSATSSATSSSTSSPIVAKYAIKKVGEAKLFKEQGESVSLWAANNYTYSGLSISIKAPDTWQRDENFDNGLAITFKNPDGRNIILQSKSIIQTCSEYGYSLGNASGIKVKSSSFIDLGTFGVGYYIKYSGLLADGTSGYFADICVTDKNNDKEVFGLHSVSKEDGDPYFVIFDKLLSTFTIKQTS